MKIILVNEECHGLIGVAKDYRAAIRFLIDKDWLNDFTEIWVRDYEYERLSEKLGEDWVDTMTENWNINDFNDFWEGSFYLEEEDLYE